MNLEKLILVLLSQTAKWQDPDFNYLLARICQISIPQNKNATNEFHWGSALFKLTSQTIIYSEMFKNLVRSISPT